MKKSEEGAFLTNLKAKTPTIVSMIFAVVAITISVMEAKNTITSEVLVNRKDIAEFGKDLNSIKKVVRDMAKRWPEDSKDLFARVKVIEAKYSFLEKIAGSQDKRIERLERKRGALQYRRENPKNKKITMKEANKWLQKRRRAAL